VVGVDLNARKIEMIGSGRAPLVEGGLEESVARGVATGRLRATHDTAEAVAATDVTFICVGTPSREDGSVDLGALKAAARDIGRAIARKDGYHLVVVRSTVPVGTTRGVVLPILETESGRRWQEDFGLCFHPEFLREGVAIADFFEPPKTVVGAADARSADMLASLYDGIGGPKVTTSIEAAEMVKYVDNTWHAVKVSFANEVGKICQSVRVDSHDVMGIFVQDQKLNLSPYYMRPGFAFGGSCLPKDVRAMCGLAGLRGVEVPLIESILRSNSAQVAHALDLVLRSRAARVGFLGVTFKPGTDDLRESPQIDLIGRLLERGIEVRAHDRNVTPEGLRLAATHAKTANLPTQAALRDLPGLLDADPHALAGWADLLVVCHGTREFAAVAAEAGESTRVLDLVRLPSPVRQERAYAGICW
jgi:GDP-mannose 6-dehydrogenase